MSINVVVPYDNTGAGRVPLSRCTMEQISPTDMEAVRCRLQSLLDERGWSARELAFLTGDDEKSVQRWVYGSTKTIPADFIGRCEAKGFAAASYLLRGDGPEKTTKPKEAVVRLEVIGKIADGQVSLTTLETIETIHHLESREALSDEMRSAIAKIRESGASQRAGP